MTSFDDEKLRQFLKRNEPTPPPAPHNELQTLMSKLGLKKTEKSSSGFPWLAFGGFGAVAAGFAAAVLIAQPPALDPSAPRAEFKTTDSTQAIAFDEDFDPEEGEATDFAPTQEVGEEFLGLIATNGAR